MMMMMIMMMININITLEILSGVVTALSTVEDKLSTHGISIIITGFNTNFFYNSNVDQKSTESSRY